MDNTSPPSINYKIQYKNGVANKVTTSCFCRFIDSTRNPVETTNYQVFSEYEKKENGYAYSNEDTLHGKGMQNFPLTLEDLAGLDSHNPSLLPIAKILGESRANIDILLAQQNHEVEHIENTDR